jgi:hypothetical protein
MQVAFVSDIHLSLRHSPTWASNRFLQLFTLLSECPASHIILGGDTFDTAKVSLEELKVFYEGIQILRDAEKIVWVISGNHENLSDHKTVFDFIPAVGFTYLEDVVLKIPNYDLYFVSHLKCKTIASKKKDISSQRQSILFSHFRANFGTFIKGEIDVGEVSKIFNHCFVGDIHHSYAPFPNVTYPSSPYSIHFDLPRDYGYFLINLDKELSYTWERLDLPCKILHTTTAEEVLTGLSLDSRHIYKVIVQSSPSTEVASKLMKNPLVDNFEFKPLEIANTEEFEDLVLDLYNHKKTEVIDTLLLLLKTNNYPISQDLEDYLRGVLKDVRD